MDNYEKLGAFYLGRPYDLKKQKPLDGLLLYDSKDLVTHAVCVGMTGSGKTGLCLALLEEAAIDGVPAILIDPKGDLSNLLLTFPQLRGEDFLPWINTEEAGRKGLAPEAFAAQQAEMWKKGLAEWGQDGERIQRLRDSADFVIYTPGSNAGLPISIGHSFEAPTPAVRKDPELLQDRVSATVGALLGLVGIAADPLQSREHILLSTLLSRAWQQGQGLDLPTLIRQVQNPPVDKIGVLDLEAVFPEKDRFTLVMALNNLLAAPGFSAWQEGEPLDVGALLHTSSGKPRMSIISIAHLSDKERMFFVTLLLSEVLAWVRSQPGTNSLRALLYMDEVFGFFPPVAEPPSKRPMLTLLKQARAYGLGIVLTTQNPADLDYKGLSNTGTWFLGRLQTERDKQRVLEGLEGVAATAGGGFDRAKMEQTLAGLQSRLFLLHNVHEDEPVVFQTRWAMSYLRGPMTRQQIKVLMDPRRPAAAAAPAMAAAPAAAAGAAPPVAATVQPTTAPDIPVVYLPARGAVPSGAGLHYQPAILGAARLGFSDAKTRVDVTRPLVALTPVTDEAVPVAWERSSVLDLSIDGLEKAPAAGASFGSLPAPASKPKSFTAWGKDFGAWLYASQKLELLRSPSTKQVSQPGEGERDFRARLSLTGRESRDAALDKLKGKYLPKLQTLQERKRRAEAAKEKQADQAKEAKLQTAISVGATLLGALGGRKVVSRSTLGRATTAARGVSRSMREQEDIGRAQDTVEAIDQQIADLNAEFEASAAELQSTGDPSAEPLETVSIKLKKVDIAVQLVALAWAPYWRDAQGNLTPAYGA
jgi:Zonular occludens toxin (Zot)